MKLNHNVYVVGKILSQRKPEFSLSPMNNKDINQQRKHFANKQI